MTSTPASPPATRDRLRRAAIDVFARKGFHDTKISDIVAAAKVTQPTFYIYFASKEAAYDTLVEEFRAALRAATEQCLISPGLAPGELFDDVRQSFVRFLTVLTADRALTEIGFFQPPGAEVTRARMIADSTANMEQEQAAGTLRADIPVAFQARLVLGLLDQIVRMEGGDLEGKADICARLFCGALAATNGRE